MLGKDAEGLEILAGAGRYGPYVKRGDDYRSLETEDQMFTVSLEGQNLLDDEQTYSINGNRMLSQGYYRYGRSFNLGVSVKF